MRILYEAAVDYAMSLQVSVRPGRGDLECEQPVPTGAYSGASEGFCPRSTSAARSAFSWHCR